MRMPLVCKAARSSVSKAAICTVVSTESSAVVKAALWSVVNAAMAVVVVAEVIATVFQRLLMKSRNRLSTHGRTAYGTRCGLAGETKSQAHRMERPTHRYPPSRHNNAEDSLIVLSTRDHRNCCNSRNPAVTCKNPFGSTGEQAGRARVGAVTT